MIFIENSFKCAVIMIISSIMIVFSGIYVAHANKTNYTQAEIYTIAARSAGEARLSGVTAVAYVACTIHNRLQRGYGNGTINGVLSAYYARDFIPRQSELAMVEYYLNGKNCPNDILYAMSYTDVIYLGWQHNDADYAIGTRFETTYFYSKWGG